MAKRFRSTEKASWYGMRKHRKPWATRRRRQNDHVEERQEEAATVSERAERLRGLQAYGRSRPETAEEV